MFPAGRLIQGPKLRTPLRGMRPQYKPYYFLHRTPTLPPPFQSLTKTYSSSSSQESVRPIPIIMYEGLVKCLEARKCTVVDVRSSREVQAGSIPTSIHVPLKDVETTFSLPPDSFQSRFGIPKPSLKDMIVCHCHAGKRSIKACHVLVGLGFRNVINYSAGWRNWRENVEGGNSG